MLVRVRVLPEAAHEHFEKTKKGFEVYVKEPPVDNRANKRVCALIARHFNVPLASVRIVSGHRSFGKIVDVRE